MLGPNCIHCKKRLAVWLLTSRLATGKPLTFFYSEETADTCLQPDSEAG
jgi:hypothetical protein